MIVKSPQSRIELVTRPGRELARGRLTFGRDVRRNFKPSRRKRSLTGRSGAEVQATKEDQVKWKNQLSIATPIIGLGNKADHLVLWRLSVLPNKRQNVCWDFPSQKVSVKTRFNNKLI